jgi:hypothetical protein
MPSGFAIRKNQYYDSVFLMGVNSRLSKTAGVRQTAVLMGSEKNKALLEDLGIRAPAIDAAGANDLVIAVVADDEGSIRSALEGVDAALLAVEATSIPSGVRTLAACIAEELAVLTIPEVCVPGTARRWGPGCVFIFSSNVPQQGASQAIGGSRGLLVMVGCGRASGCVNRIRQRRASRADRRHRPVGHRPSGVHLPDPPRGWRDLSRHRDGQPRPVE